MATRKTSCPAGHPYNEENTYLDKRGARHCRTCRRDRMQARREGTQVGYANAKKTECPQGHPYDEANTYRGNDGRRWCRACMAANSTLQNIKRYGVTTEEVDALLVQQLHACAICRTMFSEAVRPHIDHDHLCCGPGRSCGKCVRGLLCKDCNHGLGRFRDNVDWLKEAAKYLSRSRKYSLTAAPVPRHAAPMTSTSETN